jgi:hypothetical protein
MQTATLHIKVSPDFADSLKKIAHKRGESVGEIVRKAVAASYQADMMSLPRPQKQALDAYCGGFISIGKLSDVMGMNLLSLRTWLDEHEIRQNTAVSPQDSDHA